VLFDVVNRGCGETLHNFAISLNMQLTYFTDASSINTSLLPNNPILDQGVLEAMFTDPYYGL
jgi:hypothetical protein